MLSLEEKKYPKYAGFSIPELLRASKANPELTRLTALRASKRLHEIYFSSFGEREYVRCDAARKHFGSETRMLSELYDIAMRLECGFVGVGVNHNKTPFLFSVGYSSEGSRGRSIFAYPPTFARTKVYHRLYPAELFAIGEPVLAVDLCEHAYFDGYTFDKERYISSALATLSIDVLGKL